MKISALAGFGCQCALLSALAAPGLALASGDPGNVRVTLNNGNLVIRGDEGDNNIIVTESGIAGRAGTRVNGKFRAFIPDGVTKDVRISLLDGDDTVRIELPGTNFAIPRDLQIETGLGDDYVELLQVRVPNDTRIYTGDGNDIVFVDGVTRFSQFYPSNFGGKFLLRTGGDEDLFEFHNTTFRRAVDVVLGGAIDGACSTQDSIFLRPDLVSFDGSGPTHFPGDGFVSPGFGFAALLGFEAYPDDCSYLGGRF
jgi:hypothetical protein